MSTEAFGPDPARVIGRLLPLLYPWRALLLVTVCCPAPAPGPHWRTALCSPSFAEDGMRVQRCFSGAENPGEALCHRHDDGGRPSLRVWCSHMMAAPAERNHVRIRCQRMTAPGSSWRKN